MAFNRLLLLLRLGLVGSKNGSTKKLFIEICLSDTLFPYGLLACFVHDVF